MILLLGCNYNDRQTKRGAMCVCVCVLWCVEMLREFSQNQMQAPGDTTRLWCSYWAVPNDRRKMGSCVCVVVYEDASGICTKNKTQAPARPFISMHATTTAFVRTVRSRGFIRWEWCAIILPTRRALLTCSDDGMMMMILTLAHYMHNQSRGHQDNKA